ncbi:MAG: hypothetical protein Q7R41_12285, partial [Phycisphaerales bacterium]|nr:hypothetical protein [Phycisphaerales bacterium]
MAALNTVGASFTAQRGIGDRARGQLLANDLMAEILAQAYEDPNETIAFGLEASETGGTNRSVYDDVDDYRSVTDSPPQLKDGTAMQGFTGWTRTVDVLRVDPNNLSTLSLSESGAKKMTITVKHGSVVVATLVGIKTSASPAAGTGGTIKAVTAPV